MRNFNLFFSFSHHSFPFYRNVYLNFPLFFPSRRYSLENIFHENFFVFYNLGWSSWSDYLPCSVSCGIGVQQRIRHCLKNIIRKMNKKKYYCEGYNIEQRNCNMFECTGMIFFLIKTVFHYTYQRHTVHVASAYHLPVG